MGQNGPESVWAPCSAQEPHPEIWGCRGAIRDRCKLEVPEGIPPLVCLLGYGEKGIGAFGYPHAS